MTRSKRFGKPICVYSMRIAEFEVIVQRRKIKNLYLRINRKCESQIKISAPEYVNDAYIIQIVQARLDWIRSTIQKQSLTSHLLLYQNNDKIWFFGELYSLVTIHSPKAKQVILKDKSIQLYIDDHLNIPSERQKLVYHFYREHLKSTIPPIVAFWQNRTGLAAQEWRLRSMKTRWGTCNPVAKRIWLSLELAKVSLPCLEYVILHEIAHLYEPSHNWRFQDFMTRHMPDWKKRRTQLNSYIKN